MNTFLYVNDIIREALVTIRSEGAFNDPTNEARQGGLYRLQGILANINATSLKIPFAVNFNFNLEAGKSIYIVGNSLDSDVITTPFTEIDYVNVSFDGGRYAVTITDDFTFLEETLFPSIVGRPGWVRLNKAEDQTTLEFYPTPDRIYECSIFGKKVISQIDFQDYMDLPDYYREYLVLELAWKLNSRLGLNNWTPDLERQRIDASQVVIKSAKIDNRVKSTPPFRHQDGIPIRRLGVVS